MNKTDLFHAVRDFFSANDFNVEAHPEVSCFSFLVEVRNITICGRVVCEEAPLAVQAVCELPVSVARRFRPAVLDLLNRLNGISRFGCHSMDPKDGRISFRLGAAVEPSLPLEDQAGEIIVSALGIFHNAAEHLAAFALVGGSVTRTLRTIVEGDERPVKDEAEAPDCLPFNRLTELN
ncbi:MAG: hypothetical protein KA004_01750 [Verrucomicrobiales bacterium]|nr:hypothetical protein [Verrucomicrobiales bacterium]